MKASAGSALKKRQIASLVLNILIVVLEIIGLRLSTRTHGKSLFQFYTEDSNIFALIACGVYAVYVAINLKNKTSVLPRWVQALKYTAVCCLMVTFIVVLFVLAPMEGASGYKTMLLYGSMLYHHLLCPVLALLSFLLLETDPPLTRKHTYIALIPTLVYAAVVLTLNITKTMVGPYPFLHVYEQSAVMSAVWCAVILGGAYLLAWLVWLANRKFSDWRKTAV